MTCHDRCRCEGCGAALVQWYYRDERILCGDCFRHGVTIRPQQPPSVLQSIGFWAILATVAAALAVQAYHWWAR